MGFRLVSMTSKPLSTLRMMSKSRVTLTPSSVELLCSEPSGLPRIYLATQDSPFRVSAIHRSLELLLTIVFVASWTDKDWEADGKLIFSSID